MSEFGNLVAHEMPVGGVIFYRDKDHSYWRDVQQRQGEWVGKGRLTGISTVSAPVDFRPDSLMRWAARMNGEGVAILAADGLSQGEPDDMRSQLAFLESADSIWNALCEGELTYEHIRDQAAVRGTNVHKHALHALAMGRAVPALDEMTEEEKGYARGVMAFWHENEPDPIHAEQVVCDLGLGVAGRLDLRARLGSGPYAGRFALIDAKTSGFIANKAHVQIAGYEHCSTVCGIGITDVQLLLQVDAKGNYALVPVEATDADFLAAVDIYRRSARIGKAAKAQRESQGSLPV